MLSHYILVWVHHAARLDVPDVPSSDVPDVCLDELAQVCIVLAPLRCPLGGQFSLWRTVPARSLCGTPRHNRAGGLDFAWSKRPFLEPVEMLLRLVRDCFKFDIVKQQLYLD